MSKLNGTIERILTQFGLDILLEEDRFCAIFNDMAATLTLEKKVLRRIKDLGLLNELHTGLLYGDEATFSRIDFKLKEAGVSTEWRLTAAAMFGYTELTNGASNPSLVQGIPISNWLQEVSKELPAKCPLVVKSSLTFETWVELSHGMRINRGFISPYMVQDQEQHETILKEPYIFITNDIIDDDAEAQFIAKMTARAGKSLLIIAKDITGPALAFLSINAQKLSCVAIRAPGFGSRRRDWLEDISLLTNGTVVSAGNSDYYGLTLDKMGKATQAIIRGQETIIITNSSNEDVIIDRINELKALREHSFTEYDKEKITERIDALEQGVGIINVGGNTVVEIDENMRVIKRYLEGIK